MVKDRRDEIEERQIGLSGGQAGTIGKAIGSVYVSLSPTGVAICDSGDYGGEYGNVGQWHDRYLDDIQLLTAVAWRLSYLDPAHDERLGGYSCTSLHWLLRELSLSEESSVHITLYGNQSTEVYCNYAHLCQSKQAPFPQSFQIVNGSLKSCKRCCCSTFYIFTARFKSFICSLYQQHS